MSDAGIDCLSPGGAARCPSQADIDAFVDGIYEDGFTVGTVNAALAMWPALAKGRRLPGGSTALHRAAARQRPDLVPVLLAAGADVNATDFQGNTPLCCCAKSGTAEMLRLLIDAGGSVNRLSA